MLPISFVDFDSHHRSYWEVVADYLTNQSRPQFPFSAKITLKSVAVSLLV